MTNITKGFQNNRIDIVIVTYKSYDYLEKCITSIYEDSSSIVELKSVEKVRDLYKKQLLTHLRLAKKPLCLLINFNETVLKDTKDEIRPTGEE